METLQREQFTADTTATGHERVSCACGRAIVRQPYMTNDQWKRALRIFKVTHRCAPLPR